MKKLLLIASLILCGAIHSFPTLQQLVAQKVFGREVGLDTIESVLESARALSLDTDPADRKPFKKYLALLSASMHLFPMLEPPYRTNYLGITGGGCLSPDCSLYAYRFIGSAARACSWDLIECGRQACQGQSSARPVWFPHSCPLGSNALDENCLNIRGVGDCEIEMSLPGHTGLINSLCFSPNDTSIVSGADDGAIKIWDIVAGECVRTIQLAHSVRSVCYSPCGRRILSGALGKIIQEWDPATGELQKTFIGHKGCVLSACYSSDGTLIVSGGSEGEIRIWNRASSACLRTLPACSLPVRSVGFNHDASALVSVAGGTVQLWDSATGRELGYFRMGHLLAAQSGMRFSDDGKAIVSNAVREASPQYLFDRGHLKMIDRALEQSRLIDHYAIKFLLQQRLLMEPIDLDRYPRLHEAITSAHEDVRSIMDALIE